MTQKEKLYFRSLAALLLHRARSLATMNNDYKFVSWKSVCDKLDIDPANMSRYQSGVTDLSASTLLAIIDAFGCSLTVVSDVV